MIEGSKVLHVWGLRYYAYGAMMLCEGRGRVVPPRGHWWELIMRGELACSVGPYPMSVPVLVMQYCMPDISTREQYCIRDVSTGMQSCIRNVSTSFSTAYAMPVPVIPHCIRDVKTICSIAYAMSVLIVTRGALACSVGPYRMSVLNLQYQDGTLSSVQRVLAVVGS
eukprot:3941906-Rhodomonas_salina.2